MRAIRGFKSTLAFVGLGIVMACWQLPVGAQVSTTAPGPYYATPSWDQKLTINRFVVLSNWNNEAVLDRETGIVWEQSPDGTQRTWHDARKRCN